MAPFDRSPLTALPLAPFPLKAVVPIGLSPPCVLPLLPWPVFPSLLPFPFPWEVVPTQPPDFPCFTAPCRVHTEEGNCAHYTTRRLMVWWRRLSGLDGVWSACRLSGPGSRRGDLLSFCQLEVRSFGSDLLHFMWRGHVQSGPPQLKDMLVKSTDHQPSHPPCNVVPLFIVQFASCHLDSEMWIPQTYC